MATEFFQLLKTLNLFNKTSLIISISVTDLLVNVILSEVCSKNYPNNLYEKPLTNLGFYYNITCNKDYNNENYSRYDMMWEDYLSRKSLTCLKYWKSRFCSSFTNSTGNCFPISRKPNFKLNDSYLGTFSEFDLKTHKSIMSMYLLQTVKVCLENFQVIVKEIRVCGVQSFKDHMFRIFPIITHSVSIVELVKTPELRFSYNYSILFYVSCLLAKAVFNVVVVSKVFTDYSNVCNMIGKNY